MDFILKKHQFKEYLSPQITCICQAMPLMYFSVSAFNHFNVFLKLEDSKLKHQRPMTCYCVHNHQRETFPRRLAI